MRRTTIVSPFFQFLSFSLPLAFVLLATGSCNAPNSEAAASSPSTIASESIVPVAPPQIDEIDDLKRHFDSLHRQRKFNGVALFWEDGKMSIIHHGERLLGSGDTLHEDDLFQLASLSKPLTALGLLTLVDDGKVELDEEVSKYLFDFPFEGVTVRSLLNHTSGLGNYLYVTDSIWNNPDSFMTNSDVYDIIRCEQLPIYYPPLKRFNYCNTNYALIPTLIEEVTGQSFIDYMHTEVFDPIGMYQTYFIGKDGASVEEMMVKGHYPNGDPKRPFYLDEVLGDKSLTSNVFDLLKLYHEMKRPVLFSDSVIQESMSPQVSVGYGRSYGLGWRIAPLAENDTIVFHNGWWRGFRSYFWMSKHEDKAFIALTNSIRGGYLSPNDVWFLY